MKNRDGSDGRSLKLSKGDSECRACWEETGAPEAHQQDRYQVLATHAEERYLTFSPTGYVGEFEVVDDRRGKKIVLDLLGRLNKCGVYSPRFDIKMKVRIVATGRRWT